MVMHIEVCQESSFFSVEDSINVILIEPDDRDESFDLPEFSSSLARDTSQTTRDSSDNTRVNIQTSILDDHEEEDEEEDEGSVLFEELQETNPSRLQEDMEETTLLGRFSPDRFFDSLCATNTRKPSSRPCPTSLTNNCMSVSCTPRVDEEDTKVLSTTPTCERMQLETNIWNLLGCSSPPTGQELESIWYLSTTAVPGTDPNAPRKRPSRASLKHRLQRIQRLRQVRWAGATRHGVTLSKHLGNTLRTVSMDQLDSKDFTSWKDPSVLDLSSASLATWLNPQMTPVLPIDEPSQDGYDSDPEFTSRQGIHVHEPLPPSMETNMAAIMEESDDPDYLIYLAVQQTLNSTWTLTWHPNPDNVQEYQVPPTPLSINIWMERGTVIPHSGVVIEPQLMWRDAYQSHRKRLNATCQKPWSIRLLNTCRIAPVTRLDKTIYPLARSAQCLVVKTCHAQEFLLEAQSPAQMESICERWKIAVARFASLAVTEDIDAIAQEFFHPTLSAQTLTIQDEMLLISESASEGSTSRSTDSSSSTPVSSPKPTTNVVCTVPTQRRWVDI